MVKDLKFDLIKISDIDNNDIYINKSHISRIKQNKVGIVEILLVNEVTIYTNESNLDLLADKLSK
jgi:hypothetical protein|tara:strand:+ start:654 stop:848 length:195 start_codon:yes stop_codon:yes gene_type:complete